MTDYPILSILVFLTLAGCLCLLPVWPYRKWVQSIALGEKQVSGTDIDNIAKLRN